MDPKLEQKVFAIQSATQDLIDLAVSAAPNANQSEAQEIEAEVHSTMLSLMASAILAHGRFSERKRAFLKIILDRPNATITDERVLTEYGSRWSSLRSQLPQFLQRAISADRCNGSASARAMLVHIQIIGNNAAIAVGDFVPLENLLIRDYIANLENHIENGTCRR